MKRNTDKLMKELLKEFMQVEEFRNKFKSNYIEILAPLLNKWGPFDNSQQPIDFLEIMAEQAISFTESVIDKDQSFSEFRKEEELKSMDSLLTKYQTSDFDLNKLKKIKQILNEIILNHYPSIYEFSSFGYRLLERNVQFYSYRFIENLNHLISQKG